MLTVREVAKRLGITRHAVRYHINRGHLKASRFGKHTWAIDEKDFSEFNKRRTLLREEREGITE